MGVEENIWRWCRMKVEKEREEERKAAVETHRNSLGENHHKKQFVNALNTEQC